MNINVTARGTKVQDSFREILENKLSKFDRFFDSDVIAEVMVENKSDRETVEITIRSSGMVYRSEQTTADRQDSLDAVADALFRQITRHKSKLTTKLRKSAFDVNLTDNGTDNIYFMEEEANGFNVVKTKRFAMKPMSVEEAILQMNLIGHQFYMFLNADTEQATVVYKRSDGDYGLIESDY